jgi:apoptosis-inducing factor 2
MASSSTHNILIIGGSVAGISEAHYLLRHVLPALTNDLSISYKVTLLSASTHFYWKVGAPRGLVNESLISISDALIPVVDGFTEYDRSLFEFVQGTAFRLNAPARRLQVKSVANELFEIGYDSLVIATGTTSNSPLFSLAGTHDITEKALKNMHARLAEARTILVAGGGPAGTETAGELGAEFGGRIGSDEEKEITILSGNSRLLPGLNARTSADAEAKLTQLGVNTRHGVRVTSTSPKIEAASPTKVLLSDGSQMNVDVYIDATGCTPNTSFLPSEWLDDRGYVKTNTSTLRLDVPNDSHVYSLGTVTSFTNGSYFDVISAVRPLADSIRLDQIAAAANSPLKREQNAENASWWSWLWSSPADPLKRKATYTQQTAEIQFVPIGRDGGVGVVFGWRVPNFMVYRVKAKTYMIEKARPLVEGDDYRTP